MRLAPRVEGLGAGEERGPLGGGVGDGIEGVQAIHLGGGDAFDGAAGRPAGVEADDVEPGAQRGREDSLGGVPDERHARGSRVTRVGEQVADPMRWI